MEYSTEDVAVSNNGRKRWGFQEHYLGDIKAE